MVTDAQVRRLKKLSKTENTKELAAAKAGMDSKTARRYLADGRLPSERLGLHLEANGPVLRLYDPKTGRWLLTPAERIAEAEAAKQQAEADVRRLRREVETLRRRLGE